MFFSIGACASPLSPPDEAHAIAAPVPTSISRRVMPVV
jgi:hypothetical protein